MDISVIIVSFNTKEVTQHCLSRVKQYALDINFEVFVVDNASSDGSADMVAEEFPWVNLIRMPENRGFARANNEAIRKASGRYVLLLNSDAFLSASVLTDTIDYMDQHQDIGILGCKLTNPDGSLQPSARMLPGPVNKFLHITGLSSRFPSSRFFGRVDFSWWDHSVPRKVGWVVGAFFLIRRATIDDIGLLDERYFLYFEEIDYCLTAYRAGWEIVFYPFAKVVHLGGQSAVKVGKDISAKGKQMISIRIISEFRFYRKMYGLCHVLISAFIEFLWNLVVFIRNCLRLSTIAAYKRSEALAINYLIACTLLKDRFGNGKRRGDYP